MSARRSVTHLLVHGRSRTLSAACFTISSNSTLDIPLCHGPRRARRAAGEELAPAGRGPPPPPPSQPSWLSPRAVSRGRARLRRRRRTRSRQPALRRRAPAEPGVGGPAGLKLAGEKATTDGGASLLPSAEVVRATTIKRRTSPKASCFLPSVSYASLPRADGPPALAAARQLWAVTREKNLKSNPKSSAVSSPRMPVCALWVAHSWAGAVVAMGAMRAALLLALLCVATSQAVRAFPI